MNSKIKELLYVVGVDLLFILGYWGWNYMCKRGQGKSEKKGQEKGKEKELLKK